MLKRKLVKAGFFGHGALFIMVSPFSVSPKAQTLSYELSTNTITQQTLQKKDTSVLSASDTTVFTAKAVAASPAIQLNTAATKYVKQFLKKNDEELLAAEKRSTTYFKIIEPVLEKYGLPVELKYLAVVESGLKPSALSHVGAKGPWQLMPATARDLGLKVSKKYDERTHYYKSTVAAAKHLKDLYNEFGDWLLVIAAYNSGAGPVYKAIKKSGSRNFWKLQYFLPAETRGHVKRFIGTHCYFQNENSLTMLTKSETTAYLKAVGDFKVKQSLEVDEHTIIAVR
ncbi:MAG: lytic transglycosylase domain-containing protein [Flavisolibacter sp.]